MIRSLALVLCLLAPLAHASDAFFRFSRWREAYAAANPEEQTRLLSTGRALALERRDALLGLLKTDPAAALARAEDPRGLPRELVALLERKVDSLGAWEVICDTRLPRGGGLERWAVVGGERLRVVPHGAWRNLNTAAEVRFRGLSLEGYGAFDDASVPRSLPQASAWTTGNKKVLLVRVDFSDAPGDPLSQSSADALLQALGGYLRAASYNKTNVTPTVTPTFRLPLTKAQYASLGSSKLLQDARTAASNGGYLGPQYDLDVIAFTKVSSWGWAGLGMVGGRGAWLNGAFSLDVTAHEIGHNLGLHHANFWQAPGDTIIGAGSSLEYGDSHEIMGSGDGHHNAWYKWDLDWFGTTEVASVTQSGSHRVYDLEQTILGGTHALKVPIGVTRDYWVEFRPAAGGVAARGAVIHWGYPNTDSANLLDMAPWSQTASDAALPIGRTFSDGTAGIHITPTGLGGTQPESLDVVVNRGLFPGNQKPTVQLAASATQVGPGQQVTFTATASDPDADTLAYFWDFGDGSASTNTATAARAWSQARDVLARVTVSDLKGGVASAQVVVRVGAPSTLRISGRVREGANGVEGVRVYAGTRFAFTDSSGDYTLVGLAAQSQTVLAVKPGWTIAPAFTNPVSLSGGSATGKDFTASRATFAIAGRVTSQGAGVQGVTVSAGQYTTTTNGNGDYTLTGVPNGGYNLTALGPSGETFAPDGFSNPVQVNGTPQAGKNFIELVYPLTGVITGLAGPHTVTDGVRSTQSTFTGGSWVWTLQKVPPGKWNLVATAAGQTIVPNFQNGRDNPVEVISAGITGLDFTSSAGVVWQIKGTVLEALVPMPGVRITRGAQTAYTDSLGRYVLPNVPDGTYTLSPFHVAVSAWTPATISAAVAGADLSGQDFAVLNANAPPTIVVRPTAAPTPVDGTFVDLTVLADDDGGEALLTYTWSSTFGPATPTFSNNGSNGAKDTRASFTQPGAYGFLVTVADLAGKTVTAQLTVLVLATTTAVNVTPTTATVEVGTDRQFVASASDQFGTTIPASGDATWTVSGGGTISSTGKFTAQTPGTYTVTAELDGKQGASTVTVVIGPIPRITAAPAATPNPTESNTTELTVTADDDEGEAGLTYTWSAVSPPHLVTFSAQNGANAGKAVTATFGGLGTFNLKVDVADARGLTASGFVTVQVVSGLFRIEVTPAEVRLNPGVSQQFTARGLDAFGGEVPLTGCTWSTTALGAVDANGLFSAGASGGSTEVVVTCGGKSGEARVMVEKGASTPPPGCGCGSGGGAPVWLGALLLLMLGGRRTARPKRSRTAGVPTAPLALALLTSCTSLTEPSYKPARSEGGGTVGVTREALGEVQQGYPSDQERMLLVLVNQARHSAKTPNNNECGDHSGEFDGGPKKTPLVYGREANAGARFTSRHLSELGCYQHDNCCVLGDAGLGVVSCLAAGACSGSGCNKTCDAGVGQSDEDRYALLGMQGYAGESLAQNVQSAYDVWCAWMQSPSNRSGIYSDAVTQASGGLYNASGTCMGAWWTLAYGNQQVTVPRIPAASAMHGPPNPFNTAQLAFAANYYDSSGKAPQRAAVVVSGHCFDLDRKWGYDDNGTYEARFVDPDVLPEGCHPYYFLFVDGDGARHTYPSTGSLQVALGQNVTCPVPYDPSAQKPADCETGVQTCPAGSSQSCYTADNQTLRFGECRQGNQVCRSGGFWSACRDMIGPFPEACDGLDNDCDGEVDEGDPGGGASCQVFGERGICVAGERHCISGKVTCVGIQAPQTETCNGQDDDCDGVPDDGFGLTRCGQGECLRLTPSCVNGVSIPCVPGVPDGGEVDDRKDNDCNGLVDDGIACAYPDGGGLGRFDQVYPEAALYPDGGAYPLVLPCRYGLQLCQTDGGWGAVTGATTPRTEVCNGVDDDCDGKFDNSVEAQNAMGWQRCGVGACTVFTGSCVGSSPITCTPLAAAAESCDGLDNDCDGTIDDGCDCRASEERSCYTGPSETRGVGACAVGKRSCVDGGYTRCQGEVKPSLELCDGVDNDCDGTVDDACVGGADGGEDGGGGSGGNIGGYGDGGQGPESPGPSCGCAVSGDVASVLAILILGLTRRRTHQRAAPRR